MPAVTMSQPTNPISLTDHRGIVRRIFGGKEGAEFFKLLDYDVRKDQCERANGVKRYVNSSEV